MFNCGLEALSTHIYWTQNHFLRKKKEDQKEKCVPYLLGAVSKGQEKGRNRPICNEEANIGHYHAGTRLMIWNALGKRWYIPFRWRERIGEGKMALSGNALDCDSCLGLYRTLYVIELLNVLLLLSCIHVVHQLRGKQEKKEQQRKGRWEYICIGSYGIWWELLLLCKKCREQKGRMGKIDAYWTCMMPMATSKGKERKM